MYARTCLNFKKRSTAELSPDHVSRSIVVCCYMTFVDNELLSLWFWRKFNLKRFSHLYARVLASPSNILNRYCTSMTKLQPFHSYFFSFCIQVFPEWMTVNSFLLRKFTVGETISV